VGARSEKQIRAMLEEHLGDGAPQATAAACPK